MPILAKTGSIQRELDQVISEAVSQERLLPGMIARAAKRKELNLSSIEIEELSVAILGATDGRLNLDLDLPCGLGVTAAEVQLNIQAIVDNISSSMEDEMESVSQAISEAVPATLEEIANLISANLVENSDQHAGELSLAHTNRVKSVGRLWGSALQRLDFLRHLVSEWDSEAQKTRRGCYSQSSTALALERLVARVYEVAGEIVVLATNGYADGALARWRTLHEVCVVAMFLARQTDECAAMYLWHHKLEELRLLRVDLASNVSSVLNINEDRYVRELRRQCASLVTKFGAAYGGDYGWAAVALGRARVTFRDLEECVGLETLRRGYQQANGAVHSGALATLTRVSLGPFSDHLSGIPPAFGCEVAARYTTASLTMLVAELCLETESADLLAMNMVVRNCAMEVRNMIDRSNGRASMSAPRARAQRRREILKVERENNRPKFRR